jgi:hypothetical protein
MPADRTATGKFVAGNRAAVKHGGRSHQEREANRRALLASMQELIAGQLPEHERTMPGSSLLVDMAAVQAADVRQLREYVDASGGPISDRGQLRKCMEMLRGRERDLLGTLDRLSFGPRARAQLMGSVRDTSVSAALVTAAQERLRARMADANGHPGRLAATEVAP